MTAGRARILALWALCLIVALALVVRARYIADLSAFLPTHPTPNQQLLVDQLRDGPASRLILVAIEGGESASRASALRQTAAVLRRDPRFSSVSDGEPATQQGEREFLFKHRYLLSDAVSAERFSAKGLHEAIAATVDDLASPAGPLFKSLLPRDPTGELLHLVDALSSMPAPPVRDGVWASAAKPRTLAVAQTAAQGSDSDAQSAALGAIRAAFAAAPAAHGLQLRLSGPAVFAVAARAKIETAAIRLSLISGALVIVLLLAAYRSPAALGLGLLPVTSGAVIGIAAVAVGFGAVHGITLGFGITLIGESVDYSIYFFVQSASSRAAGRSSWTQRWWPTVRLGMLTSVCGFASLLPSGFPGLAQLGLYSISGLIAAALVTRFVLPALLPRNFAIHDLSAFGARLATGLDALRAIRALPLALLALGVAAALLVAWRAHGGALWNHELSALSPVSIQDQDYDAELRADLGAADVRDVVIVSAPDLNSALLQAERAAQALQTLVDAGVIGSFENPAVYVPSRATQERRRDSLPAPATLHDMLRQALKPADGAALPLRLEKLQPFLEDVESTRHGALISARELRGTSLGTAFESLILQQHEQWHALLPLRAATTGAQIDFARVGAALDAAHLGQAQLLDLKRESDELYAQYLQRALRLSLAGFVALTLLLAVVLRSAARVARVLAPLVLAVLVVTAILAASGVELTILHLVGLLLIIAVGSNYALFFDRQSAAHERGGAPLMLASLVIANASTVIGFGLLSFSQVPVLVSLGTTVAPGALLALLFAALLAPDA
jgi:predicted exporter